MTAAPRTGKPVGAPPRSRLASELAERLDELVDRLAVRVVALAVDGGEQRALGPDGHARVHARLRPLVLELLLAAIERAVVGVLADERLDAADVPLFTVGGRVGRRLHDSEAL